MKTFKISFIYATSQTCRSQCGRAETGKLDHFFQGELGLKFLQLCLIIQHLHLKCHTNPKSLQPSTIHFWKQPRQGSSRSMCAQPPHLPNQHARSTGKAGQRCDIRYASRGQAILAFDGVHKEKQRTKVLKSVP